MGGLVAALLGDGHAGRAGTGDRDGGLPAERVRAALAAIAHRGPDRTGTWRSTDGRMVLGHARLATVDLDGGDQPITHPAGDLHCAVDGELYGHREPGAALHLYDRLGCDAAHELRGEFAVVIADERRGRLVAVRDRFGVKPLFYAVHRGDVLVASEVKALLALGVPARWDGEAFFAECHNARTDDRTLFAGVYAVPPGCLLVARPGHVQVRRYWDTRFPPREVLAADPRQDAEVVARFRELLDDAVGQRLVADVEVGAYLSGGLDSTAVLALAQRRSGRPVSAFTTVWTDGRFDEGDQAQHSAERLGAKFVPVPMRAADVPGLFADAVWHAETLAYSDNIAAKFQLSKAVHEAGVRVVLTGGGADEILAGYPPLRRDLLLHPTEGLEPEQLAALLAQDGVDDPAACGLRRSDPRIPAGLEAFGTRLGWVPAAVESFHSHAAQLHPFLRDGFREAGLRADPYTELLDALDVPRRLAGRDPLNQALYVWLRTQLPNVTLAIFGDRTEMAHSVQARLPLLDHPVAEFAAGLPVHHKIRGLREKNVLREAVAGDVPPEVYDRRKHAFLSPPVRAADDPLAVFCQDTVRSAALDDQPFFEPARVRAAMDRVAGMRPAERAAAEGVILRVVSTCVLQDRYGLTA